MTLSIKNGGYAFLIRLDLIFSISLWKHFQMLQILNEISIKYLIKFNKLQNEFNKLKNLINYKIKTKTFHLTNLVWKRCKTLTV